jgi:replicative superfamily II helicase
LVKQALDKSAEYGIPTVQYVRRQALASEFTDGSAILVGTYEALFNGRSRFGVRGSGDPIERIGLAILDDAHVALASVRDAFTLTIESAKHSEIYADITNRFRGEFHHVGRGGTFDDIVSGKEWGAVLEVPSGAWLGKVPEIQEYLRQHSNALNRYVWPLVRDFLRFCCCLISRNSVSITPILPPVDLLPSFVDCPRRVYMSATIADDSDIIRTFDASLAGVSTPITSVSLAGVGERMILVPELMSLPETPVGPLIKDIAQRIAKGSLGVTILTPSGTAAKKWEDIAVYPNTTDAVLTEVQRMQAGETYGPIVLANRYDGIDLPGKSCRFLVMAGLPRGTSDYELYRASVLADGAVNALLAQRIEQGIGRGTRGASDYCAVILMGKDLVGWVGRSANLRFLTSSTRVQLEVGREISRHVSTVKEFKETLLKCLQRDPAWIRYHADELASGAMPAAIDSDALQMAAKERRIFRLYTLRQFEKAIQELDAMRSTESDTRQQGWLLALTARIAHHAGDSDRAQRYQTSAYVTNRNLTPPLSRPAYVSVAVPGSQSKAIIAQLLSYGRRRAILADFDEAVAGLVPEASSERFEQSLSELGRYLGLTTQRPDNEFRVGPDVLWITSGPQDFVIEAKSRKEAHNPLYKGDHAQLLEAEQWFKTAYPGRTATRVSALREAVADRQASPAGTMALTLDALARLSWCAPTGSRNPRLGGRRRSCS